VGVGFGVEISLGVLQTLFDVTLFVAELHPFIQYGGFVLGFRVVFDSP